MGCRDRKSVRLHQTTRAGAALTAGVWPPWTPATLLGVVPLSSRCTSLLSASASPSSLLISCWFIPVGSWMWPLRVQAHPHGLIGTSYAHSSPLTTCFRLPPESPCHTICYAEWCQGARLCYKAAVKRHAGGLSTLLKQHTHKKRLNHFLILLLKPPHLPYVKLKKSLGW